MHAHAILAVIAAHERAQHHDSSQVPLTVNDIRRLFAKLAINTVQTIDYLLA